MRTLFSTLALGALLALSSVAIAADPPDPVIGTWKLDPAKSTANTPPVKSEIRTYTASADGVALVWERVSADDKKSIVKTTFKYDGKDYPVTGSPDLDAMSWKRIDANTIETTLKLKGKNVGTTRRAVSADGKTLTLHQRRTTASGQQVSTLMVYDRQ